ncbi:uncharacterized protein LOC130548271 [Triplophysa rosa]|uniref:uncharacterized protein LOC130548271 n=1 Tax=Triplophysa rosa TaxID=992332 RepID=UPI0025462D20|nr:uncharacterized protein LOC130548271 [Triplophysa rosa]
MRIIQIQLYVLIWCQATEALDQLTDLGQNVTINCDLDANEVYWILLKQSDSPTVILRSFSKSAHYFNKTLKNKYSVQSKHRLVIYNVTVDELGVYYCMNTDTPPKLSHSTRLNIIADITSSYTTSSSHTSLCKNHIYIYSFGFYTKRHASRRAYKHFVNTNHTNVMQNLTDVAEKNSKQWKTFTLISGLLNAVLIITIMGLLKVYVIGNGCSKKYGSRSGHHSNTDLQQTQVIEQTQDTIELQYVAVDFSKLRRNIRPCHDNSTYAALNLPKS